MPLERTQFSEVPQKRLKDPLSGYDVLEAFAGSLRELQVHRLEDKRFSVTDAIAAHINPDR